MSTAQGLDIYKFYWCDLNVAVCVFQGARALLLCTMYLCTEEHTFTQFLDEVCSDCEWPPNDESSWLWFCFSRGCFYTYNAVLVQGYIANMHVFTKQLSWKFMRTVDEKQEIKNCCGLIVANSNLAICTC